MSVVLGNDAYGWPHQGTAHDPWSRGGAHHTVYSPYWWSFTCIVSKRMIIGLAPLSRCRNTYGFHQPTLPCVSATPGTLPFPTHKPRSPVPPTCVTRRQVCQAPKDEVSALPRANPNHGVAATTFTDYRFQTSLGRFQ